MKTNTSVGPSGITFAMMKAGTLDEEICAFDAAMTELPFQTGFAPERWRHGTDVMIEKKAGNFNVEKLRAILLYEADFNFGNKVIGREAMYTAEHLHGLAVAQYGSRAKLSAIDHCVNKVLTYDIFRLQRRNGAIC